MTRHTVLTVLLSGSSLVACSSVSPHQDASTGRDVLTTTDARADTSPAADAVDVALDASPPADAGTDATMPTDVVTPTDVAVPTDAVATPDAVVPADGAVVGLTARAGLGAATSLDGTVYLVGGATASGPTDLVEVYDPATGTVHAGPSLPSPRFNVGAATTDDGTLYAVGGWSSTAEAGSGSAFIASLPRGGTTWTMQPAIPHPTFCNSAAYVGHGVFTVGGGVIGAYIQRFDTVALTWSSVAAPFLGIVGGLAAGGDGRVYALVLVDGPPGGDALWAFDPSTGMWSSPVLTTVRRNDVALVASNGSLYVAGGSEHGSSAVTVSGQLQRIAAGGTTWAALPDLPTARTGLAAAVANGRIYVFDGQPTGDPQYADLSTTPLALLEVFDPGSSTWLVAH